MIVILIHFDIFQFLGGYYRNQSPPVSYSVPSPCHSRSIFKLQSKFTTHHIQNWLSFSIWSNHECQYYNKGKPKPDFNN